MNKKKVSIILGIMWMILTIAIVVQYKTIKNANSITGNAVNSELKTEVLKWKEKYETTYAELENSEKELEEQRNSSTYNDTNSKEIQEELKKLNSIIGNIDVKGKGVVITVEDNKYYRYNCNRRKIYFSK